MTSPVIIALDYSSEKEVLEFVSKVQPGSCRLKVGKELFVHAGPALVKKLITMGFDVFLDLKFHDIPNTVAKACLAAADMGVWMMNVHASGGRRMMETASAALANHGTDRPLLIAVTVLTSMAQQDLAEVGIDTTPENQVLRLAKLTADAGLDGVVCSALEVQTLSAAMSSGFIFVTPGIRPAGSSNDDQRRIMTPEQAMKAGSDYLVIGRPITQSDSPMDVLETINRQVQTS
jgi:orotidine-5'-phosphate decarboxylase